MPHRVSGVFAVSIPLPFGCFASAHGRIRTCDARFRKPTLYPLSYAGESGLSCWLSARC